MISLFGGDAVFEPMIELGSERGLLTPHHLLTNPPMGVRIHPQTRKVDNIKAADLVGALPPGF